jgi:uncharacterized protein involved in outer membrane biogenesis
MDLLIAMNETTSSPAPARRGWLRKLVWLAGILVVLLVAVFFGISSGAFVKGVLLPRVGNALNADLAVGDAAFSPFSRLELRDVKLTPKGREPLFTANVVRARYGLLSILGGRIAVDEITLESPTITVIENADGTSNLDPLLKPQKSGGKSQPSSGKSSRSPSLDVKSVSLKNATIRRTTSLKGGGRESVEFSNLNLTVANLHNGATGKFDLSAELAVDNTVPESAGTLRGKLSGSYSFDLTADLNPAKLNGSGAFTVEKAEGKLAELAALAATLDCEATATEVKRISLRFTQAGQPLGEVRASGPFDAAKSEGKLNVVISSIDHRVLNLFGAVSGLDFGTTVINSTNVVELTKGGSLVTTSGQLNAEHVRLTRQGQSTPTLDVACDYAVTVDNTAKAAVLKSFNLTGTQNSQPLLRGELTSPMTFAFGTANAAASDAALTLRLTSLNLADWRAFAPDLSLGGTVNATVKLVSQEGGKKLSAELDGQLAGVGAILGSQTWRDVGARLQARVTSKEGSAFTGRFAITNLSGRNGETAFADLAVALDFDVAMKERMTTLNQCSLTLAPTARAKNELRLTGSVDTSKPNAITGALKLAADSLDATAYYDAFAGQPASETATPPPAATSASTDNTEPAAIKLPFNNFIAEVSVGRFYLREVDAQNFQLVVKLDSGHLLLKPAQLTLNGAPISATVDLDLSMPGFKYDVTFSANGVPVEPLANSFSPTYRGQAKGTIIASANLKGAGVTGRSLQKTLTGDANLNFTNANIQIVGPKVKAVLTPIAFVLGAPELLRSPLKHLAANLRAATGKIEVPVFAARTDALTVQSQGVVPIADVLTDSPLDQDIEISLARNLANKLRLSSAPTNADYVKLPTFVRLKGTLGNPKAKTDSAVILTLTAASFTGGSGGKILEGVGGLLGGKPAPAAAPATNAARSTATNVQPQSPVSDLINIFKKPKK